MVFCDLVGKTLVAIDKIEDFEIQFTDSDGVHYRMYHSQHCCEQVAIEDICGNLQDLIGSPIIQAEECTSEDDGQEKNPEGLWTFYRIATIKGSVVIRWYGEWEYYSVAVGFEKAEGADLTIYSGAKVSRFVNG